jgi:hypothetical protein
MVNVVPKAFVVKQDVSVSSSYFPSSTFIDFNNRSNEDVCLLMSSNVDVCNSFSTSISDMYHVQDMPSNLNHVQGQSFETIIDYLKAMFVAPHLSNELRSLDYNKIKIEYVSSLPITFNDNIIFEMSPICLPIGHFGQMQGMDRKYNGHAWCKVKTSNIKNDFGLGFRNIGAWGTCIVIMILTSISSVLLFEMKYVGPMILPKFP